MRKIIISGEISEDSFKEFCEQMDVLEEEVKGLHKTKDIEIELNSAGGSALDAIAFLGRIRRSTCDVNVTVYGFCGSAAVLVLAACDLRRMTKESWVMVHEDMGSYKNIKTSDLEAQARTARLLEDQWSQLLEELTGTKKETWLYLHENGDTYLTPEECLKLGLIQEIV